MQTQYSQALQCLKCGRKWLSPPAQELVQREGGCLVCEGAVTRVTPLEALASDAGDGVADGRGGRSARWTPAMTLAADLLAETVLGGAAEGKLDEGQLVAAADAYCQRTGFTPPTSRHALP